MARVDVFAAALAALDTGRGVAIAAVVGAKGSTPRHLGARMAVASDGEQWGTIGGGQIERMVSDAAREVAGGAAATVVRRHLVRDLAMCCGGAMEVAITPANDSRGAIELLVHSRDLLALETPLDGGAMLVRAARPGDPRMHVPDVHGDRLVERVGGRERAIVFGIGHVTRGLGPMLYDLGFEVILCDDDETGALASIGAPAWAGQIVESFDAADVERELGGFTADDYVLVLTRDHAIDQRLLEYLIARDALGYLGMIGSRGKVGRFHKRLVAKGLVAAEHDPRWAKLSAPIGLDIGAETPDEIAIAIAAELVARRRRGVATVGDWAVRKRSDA
ncbi:MAG TPA: XdhC family protein [Kofleriaceae bacterium]|jgi:xanthine dehydrogenase accessory factor|nr:XdhC family protein [Kofleriaceae bacterium]